MFDWQNSNFKDCEVCASGRARNKQRVLEGQEKGENFTGMSLLGKQFTGWTGIKYIPKSTMLLTMTAWICMYIFCYTCWSLWKNRREYNNLDSSGEKTVKRFKSCFFLPFMFKWRNCFSFWKIAFLSLLL